VVARRCSRRRRRRRRRKRRKVWRRRRRGKSVKQEEESVAPRLVRCRISPGTLTFSPCQVRSLALALALPSPVPLTGLYLSLITRGTLMEKELPATTVVGVLDG